MKLRELIDNLDELLEGGVKELDTMDQEIERLTKDAYLNGCMGRFELDKGYKISISRDGGKTWVELPNRLDAIRVKNYVINIMKRQGRVSDADVYDHRYFHPQTRELSRRFDIAIPKGSVGLLELATGLKMTKKKAA